MVGVGVGIDRADKITDRAVLDNIADAVDVSNITCRVDVDNIADAVDESNITGRVDVDNITDGIRKHREIVFNWSY